MNYIKHINYTAEIEGQCKEIENAVETQIIGLLLYAIFQFGFVL